MEHPEREISLGYLQDCAATHVDIEPGRGVLFLKMRRQYDSEQKAGLKVRRMFAELTPGEAVTLHATLGQAIGIAIAATSQPPGLDSSSPG